MSETASSSTVDDESEAPDRPRSAALKDVIVSIGGCLTRFLVGFAGEMSAMEYLFIKMYHVYSFICQLFFLALCEVAVEGRRERPPGAAGDARTVSGLTTLLFYSVFGYFVSRVREVCAHEARRRRGGGGGGARRGASAREYAYWACKVAIEWAKTVVIVVCLREQGLDYRPDAFYNAVTFAYYLCTERITAETIEAIVAAADLAALDSMEYLYVPIALKSATALASAVLVGSLLRTPHAKYALLASYFLLYLNAKDLVRNYVRPLILERRTYASFRMASSGDLETWDDVCAVCLNKMSRARITPCNHLFHPHCLKRCLKNSLQCPLCKRNFLQPPI